MATPKIPTKKVVPPSTSKPDVDLKRLKRISDVQQTKGRRQISRFISNTAKNTANLIKTKTAGGLMAGQIQGSRLKGSITNLVNNPKLKSIINKVKTSSPKITKSLKNIVIDTERLTNNINAKNGFLGRARSVKYGNILQAVLTVGDMRKDYEKFRKIGYTDREAKIKAGFVQGSGLLGGITGAQTGAGIGKLFGLGAGAVTAAVPGAQPAAPVVAAVVTPAASLYGAFKGYQYGEGGAEHAATNIYDFLSGTTEKSIALRRAKGLISPTPGIKNFDTLSEKQKQSPAYKEIQRLQNLGVTSSADDNPTKVIEQPVVKTKPNNNNKTTVIRNNIKPNTNVKVKPGDKLAMANTSKKSNVFTKHYKTGKDLGVMTRNQRKNYEKEAAGREWKGGGGTKFVGENSTWIDRNNNVIAPRQKQEAIA